IAQGGVAPDPEQENALAWKWDPLLRATSPLPITDDALHLIMAQATARVLAIRGEKGMLPAEAELRARFPSLNLTVETIPGTGHHVHIDAPQAVAGPIRGGWRDKWSDRRQLTASWRRSARRSLPPPGRCRRPPRR